eukprot:TRINITY_DN27230_c0_g1_i1.p1 TRINITY_DN27230_c0_g1~~TRINITY_DN27230_c0_g1_i1.p1  ORF type:complete len:155 (-),score=49.91 TRINITY_DN27230_c0_g1_i1:95-496(-)
MAKLDSEVKGLRDEIQGSESKYHILENQTKLLSNWQDLVQQEIKLYVSNKPEDKKKSMRDKFLKIIGEGEKKGKALKDEQRIVRESVNDNAKQTKLWSDLEKLFQVKKECLDRANQMGGATIHRTPGTETLVL